MMGIEDVAAIANLIQNVGITLVVVAALSVVSKYLFTLYIKGADARLADVKEALTSQLDTTKKALDASEKQREALQQLVFEKVNTALVDVALQKNVDHEALDEAIREIQTWREENARLHRQTLDAIHRILPQAVQRVISDSIVQEVRGTLKEAGE